MTNKSWKPLPSIGWKKEIRETVEVVEDTVSRYKELEEWYYQHTSNKNLDFKEWLEKRKEIRDIEREDIKEGQKFIKKHPPKKSIALRIYKKFDAWYEKYKDSFTEIDYVHAFEEGWYWGSVAPGSEEEFCDFGLLGMFAYTPWHHNPYYPIFEVCRNRVMKRIEELEGGWKNPHEEQMKRIGKIYCEFINFNEAEKIRFEQGVNISIYYNNSCLGII